MRSAFAERDEQQRRYRAALAAAGEAEKANVPKPAMDKPLAELVETVAGAMGLCAIPADKVEGLMDETQRKKKKNHNKYK